MRYIVICTALFCLNTHSYAQEVNYKYLTEYEYGSSLHSDNRRLNSFSDGFPLAWNVGNLNKRFYYYSTSTLAPTPTSCPPTFYKIPPGSTFTIKSSGTYISRTSTSNYYGGFTQGRTDRLRTSINGILCTPTQSIGPANDNDVPEVTTVEQKITRYFPNDPLYLSTENSNDFPIPNSESALLIEAPTEFDSTFLDFTGHFLRLGAFIPPYSRDLTEISFASSSPIKLSLEFQNRSDFQLKSIRVFQNNIELPYNETLGGFNVAAGVYTIFQADVAITNASEYFKIKNAIDSKFANSNVYNLFLSAQVDGISGAYNTTILDSSQTDENDVWHGTVSYTTNPFGRGNFSARVLLDSGYPLGDTDLSNNAIEIDLIAEESDIWFHKVDIGQVIINPRFDASTDHIDIVKDKTLDVLVELGQRGITPEVLADPFDIEVAVVVDGVVESGKTISSTDAFQIDESGNVVPKEFYIEWMALFEGEKDITVQFSSLELTARGLDIWRGNNTRDISLVSHATKTLGIGMIEVKDCIQGGCFDTVDPDYLANIFNLTVGFDSLLDAYFPTSNGGIVFNGTNIDLHGGTPNLNDIIVYKDNLIIDNLPVSIAVTRSHAQAILEASRNKHVSGNNISLLVSSDDYFLKNGMARNGIAWLGEAYPNVGVFVIHDGLASELASNLGDPYVLQVVAHELLHTVGQAHTKELRSTDTPLNFIGTPTFSGYDVRLQHGSGSIKRGRFSFDRFDIMDPIIYPDQNYHWISPQDYISTFERFKGNKIDPEIIIIEGLIDQFSVMSNVVISEHPSGFLTPEDDNGQFELVSKDSNGEVVNNLKLNFNFEIERIGSEGKLINFQADRVPFSVAIPKTGNEVSIELMLGEYVLQTEIINFNPGIEGSIDLVFSNADYSYTFSYSNLISGLILNDSDSNDISLKMVSLSENGDLFNLTKNEQISLGSVIDAEDELRWINTDNQYGRVHIGTIKAYDGNSESFESVNFTISIPQSSPVSPIMIDIEPRKKTNKINLRRKQGMVTVGVLTTDEFDASSIGIDSVAFGRGGATEKHSKLKNRNSYLRSHMKDFDRDGDKDLLLHFRKNEIGIECGDTEIVLNASTIDGQSLVGSDSIVTRGCGN